MRLRLPTAPLPWHGRHFAPRDAIRRLGSTIAFAMRCFKRWLVQVPI
jgi:hypothetical protein